MPDVIQAEDLYRFHEVHGENVPILRNIDLAITEGGFLTILGPPGSGKSTLLRILRDLDGQILLSGINLAAADEGAHAHAAAGHRSSSSSACPGRPLRAW